MYLNKNCVKEGRTRVKPSARDIKDTKRVLLDFHIETDIPQFDTFMQLQKWQKQVMREKLFG
ncbi:hypothetical protein [Anaerotignum sp.]|uniref:hypothetical protein n=1 Tax=Anaerotignum sp. TaxID=2039241 RepID=UPI002897946E|nr:hypothetical protein [Anaerotignum sp.]